MPKINIIQLGTQGVDMKSSPLLVGDKRRVHSATNLVFDEGVIRTRPGFVYTTTEAVGQFNGAASFRPRKGLSAAPMSAALSGIAVVVDGVPILGCHPLGESFGCKGDVHTFQAENYLIFQNPTGDTFWWDGITLTRSPGSVEIDWTETETPFKEIEHVAPVALETDCREDGKESDFELRFLVLDCDTREPIPEPLWEIRHNNHKAYSGMGDDEGRFSLNPTPRSYNYDVRKLGYLPVENVPFVITGEGVEYEFDTCVDPQILVGGEREILVLLCVDPDYVPPSSSSSSGGSDSSSSSTSSSSGDSGGSSSSGGGGGGSSSNSSSSSSSSYSYGCCVQINFINPNTEEPVCAEMAFADGVYSYEDIAITLDEGSWYVTIAAGPAEFLTTEECPHGVLTYDGLELTFGPCTGCPSSSGSGSDSGSGSSSSSSGCVCDFTINNITYESGDNSGGFSLTNNGTCNVTVVAFDGVGFVNFPDLPFTVVPGDTNSFGILDVFDTETAWRIETEECGFSQYYNWL